MIKEYFKNTNIGKKILLFKRIKSDPKFKVWIKDYDQCHSIMKFEEFGELNPDINIYYMRFDCAEWGFFAYWKFGIMALAFSDRYGLTPVIDWTKNSPYYEADRSGDTDNPFEYYYERVSSISCEEALKSRNVVFYSPQACGFGQTLYADKSNEKDFVHLNKKYMKLKPDIKCKLDQEINDLIGDKKTLGIHVRGVEWGNIEGHPIPLGIDIYIKQIDDALKKNDFEQIFLATDSEDTIEYLSKEYKDMIVYFVETVRAKKGSRTLAIFDQGIERKDNHFLLGYEVLRDMMALSVCQGIVAGLSNISLAAEITKKGGGKEYEYKHIFENRLNRKGITAKKAIELMKKGKF